MTLDDGALLALVAAPDAGRAREALAELYARHARAVLAYLDRSLGSPHDAEDILHDLFLTAARRAASFRGTDARPWLLTLATNRLRDRRRSESRRDARERAVEEQRSAERPGATPAELALESALGQLPSGLREAVELRFAQGLPHAEVARILGVSLRTAKARSAAALARLRALLGGGAP